MNQPIYAQDKHSPKLQDTSNTGLWFDRFFNQYQKGWSLDAQGEKPKTQFLENIVGDSNSKKVGNPDQLKSYQERTQKLASAQANNSIDFMGVFENDWHFVTGMGNPHPVENGITWHPTLATPYLPASSVKGMVRAFMEQEMEDQGISDKDIERIFGSTDQSGSVIFFDATPTEPVTLTIDVITPHMGDWYAKGTENDSVGKASAVPADWHAPVPSQFLVCKGITLFFAVAPRRAHSEQDFKDSGFVWDALKDALEWIGAGAKTSVGYGYFLKDDGFTYDLQQSKEQARKESRSEGEAYLEDMEVMFKTGNQAPGGELHAKVKEALESSSTWSTQEQAQLVKLAEKVGKAMYPKSQNYKKKFKTLLDKQPHLKSLLS